ncbi:CapA family protein [Nonomuraea sediminis]|uniref:CapA family protein n=1 Tax=Nonomuraea sediminis TaxID=2835864 RepID=UPI001BDCBB9B|nr:CapA family protein [Nonomuraea sediminis]
MSVTVAMAGDTMLGRGVAEQIDRGASVRSLFSAEVRALLAGADFVLLNLECCISDRGSPWGGPAKVFHFRAPPRAADLLSELGVGCVTLANNHALDFGYDALADTFDHLARAGIRFVGAGQDEAAAHRPAELDIGGLRLGVVGFADHPADFAARAGRPGTAYADLDAGVPAWLPATIGELREHVDVVLVTPHWGPNMITEPLSSVRTAARALIEAGADLVAGHSAHVFHGVAPPVMFDLGDFIDDYARHPRLRNDLGLLWLITLDKYGPVRLAGVPIRLDYCRTRIASGDDLRWVRERLAAACARLGCAVHQDEDALTVECS